VRRRSDELYHLQRPALSDQVGAATAYSGVFPNYLELESQSPESLASSLWANLAHGAYHSIRDRPIALFDNRLSIILDPTYYSDKLSVGPLFHLISANPRLANELFSKFGLAFEDYAIDALKRMYPERPGLVSRLAYNVLGKAKSGRPFEIDAVLHDVRALVIFEIKATWLSEDTILDDYETLIRQIRLRYGVNLDSSGAAEGKPKGVAQLSQIIGAIARREWAGVHGEFGDARINISGTSGARQTNGRSRHG